MRPGVGRVGRGLMEPQGPKRIRSQDVAAVALARFLSKLLPFILIATILVLCLAVYLVAWSLKKNP